MQFKQQEEVKITKSKPKSSNYEPKKVEEVKSTNAFECLKNKKSGQRTYIELEKEHCELPHISLAETDENLIMDYGVKIRYGDSKNFSEASRELESYIMKDYPLEIFLQRTEILNATLDIMVSTIDLRVFHNSLLILNKFVENSVFLYKFLLNPYNRFCEHASLSMVDQEEHIEKMYPSNSKNKWMEVKFNPDSLNSTNYDSQSLSYILCEIAVKSLD